METVEPTVARAIRLFIAFAWRCVLYTVFGTVIGGIVLGVMFFILELNAQAQQIVLAIATYVIGLPAAFLAAQHCLGAKIGDFRVLLVKAD